MDREATLPPDERHNAPTDGHSPTPSGDAVSSAITRDIVTQLYANSTSGLIASAAFASVLVATHWSLIAHPVLLAWWNGMALLTIPRAFLISRFKTAGAGTAPPTWHTRHLAGVALSGIGWGAAGILLFTPASVEHQAFLSLILTGMVAGAAPIFAASRRTFLAFALPACLPIIGQFLLMGDSIHVAIGVAGLLFLGIMTGLVWTINKSLVRTFELSAERTQAETQLIDLFEHTHDLIQSVAPDGRLLFVNRAWRETLGYSSGEVEMLNIFDVLHPDGHDHCRHFMRRILAGEDIGLMEVIFLTKDGRTVIAEGQIDLRVEDGRPIATRGIFRDITGRKVAETRLRAVNQNLELLVTERTGKLRESEALHRNLVATVPGAVYEFQIDAAGRRAFPFMSQGITELIGLSPDECMADADAAFQRILPEALPAVEASISQSLESLSPWLHEFPATTPSGETKWLRGHSVPTRDSDGTTRWQGVLTDITARKQAEEALRASEERFRAAYYNAAIGMSICDLDGRLQEVNQALCHILGYSKQELLAKDFQSLTHPKDLPGNMDRIRRLLAGLDAHQVFEKRYVRKDGGIVWAQVGLSVIRDHNNAPSHLLAMVQDITERKQAESRLRTTQYAIDQATDCIFVIGSDSYFLDVNESACRRLGYSKQELLTKSVLDIDPDFSPAVWETFWSTFTQQKQLRIETRHRSKSGEIYPVEVVANYIEHEGKELDYAFVRDITERKRAEEALRESEALTKTVLNTLSPHIAVLDKQGLIIAVNESWTRFARENGGEKAGSLSVGANYLAACLPASTTKDDTTAQEARDGIQAVLNGSLAKYALEYTCDAPDTKRWFVMTVLPMTGAHQGVVISHENITERKQVELALQFLSSGIGHLSLDEFFQHMARHIAQAIGAEIGFVGKLLPTDAPCIRTIGFSIDGQMQPPMEYDLRHTPCEQVIGKHTAIFPDGVQHLFPQDQMLTDLGIASYAAVPLFDTNGRPIGHVGIMGRAPLRNTKQVEDLLRLFAVSAAVELERQRTEAKFHDLFEFSPDAVIMVNQQGLITLANRQAETLFGYRQEELTALPVERLMPESGRHGHIGLRERFLATATPRLMGAGRPDLQAQRKDGTVFPVDIGLSPIDTEEGRMVVATIRDITARKQAEAALKDSQDQIQQMQKMEALGQLAGGVAHDFNNILTAILGNAEIALLKSEAEHPAKQNLARILEAGQRASHVVQQILTFTRRQDVSRSVLTLAPVVQEAVTLLRATLPAGIELTATCEADTPHVLANTTQLHQVLMNLCTNAWHALEDQPGRITVALAPVTLSEPLHSLHATVLPGHYARLSVRDTGCGMPPETLARIFDPFFTTKPLGQGTGLGLSVVHGIMEGHHGAVLVESAPGQGTAFHLYFPAAEAPAQASEPRTTPQTNMPQRPCRVLYLDDEEMLVELVRALFEPLGYRITGCTKPAEALALVRADPDGFDAVVTDYNMPERSGLDVARELAQIRRTLPVVLVSGYLTPEDQAAALDAQVKEIIYKPTMLQELGTVLSRLLDRPPAA
ncbi:MAG: PAS domain S-box protein [Nitrospira sp.]|jgi:PAS domain S-box-containing protein|nr:PAS domain S-box protein [Nitrospira sp.]